MRNRARRRRGAARDEAAWRRGRPLARPRSAATRARLAWRSGSAIGSRSLAGRAERAEGGQAPLGVAAVLLEVLADQGLEQGVGARRQGARSTQDLAQGPGLVGDPGVEGGEQGVAVDEVDLQGEEAEEQVAARPPGRPGRSARGAAGSRPKAASTGAACPGNRPRYSAAVGRSRRPRRLQLLGRGAAHAGGPSAPRGPAGVAQVVLDPRAARPASMPPRSGRPPQRPSSGRPALSLVHGRSSLPQGRFISREGEAPAERTVIPGSVGDLGRSLVLPIAAEIRD